MNMTNIAQWYPFLWALDAAIGTFALILWAIYSEDFAEQIENVRTDLRDKLHFAMSQSPKRGVA